MADKQFKIGILAKKLIEKIETIGLTYLAKSTREY
jgi:hypothetical protein